MEEKKATTVVEESKKQEIQKSKEEPNASSLNLPSKRYEDIHFVDSTKPVWNYSRFSGEDIQNFQRGTHYKLYELFGSHEADVLGTKGFYFAVWAPNATYVSVIGNFNDWNKEAHPLYVRLERSGIWEGFIPNLPKGEVYKYHIHGFKGKKLDKGDPYGNFWEKRPHTATITWNLDYQWGDGEWMKKIGRAHV